MSNWRRLQSRWGEEKIARATETIELFREGKLLLLGPVSIQVGWNLNRKEVKCLVHLSHVRLEDRSLEDNQDWKIFKRAKAIVIVLKDRRVTESVLFRCQVKHPASFHVFFSFLFRLPLPWCQQPPRRVRIMDQFKLTEVLDKLPCTSSVIVLYCNGIPMVIITNKSRK